VSGQLHVPAALPPGKSPGTHWTAGWLDPQSGSGKREEETVLTLGLELRPFGRPDRSQSLCRLRHPGSLNLGV
jgi:hypothetical protein